MSAEYQRGYSKGYQAGSRRSERAVAKMREFADRAAARAELAEAHGPYGHCDECTHWRKGCDNCAWGFCECPKSAGSPWGCYMSADSTTAKVMTTPKFGCFLFQRKAKG